MARLYRSDALASAHELAETFFRAGTIDRRQLREYEAACLAPPAPLAPEAIRSLREREGATQEVFAHFLGVTKNLVSDWERGVKKPGGPARRLLALVESYGLALFDPPAVPEEGGARDAAE